MNNIINNKKGMALVVTLAIVAILVPAALQLNKFTGEPVMATLKEKDHFQAQQFAVAGIELARLILSDDASKNSIDSIQETWADPDILVQAVKEMGLDKSNLTIKITDELSKIQVNALLKKFPGNEFNIDQVKIWERLLNARFSNDNSNDDMVAQENLVSIINCVKDWLDSLDDDAASGISGAESDYYLGLEPSYVCSNAPFNHLDELLNVKGISKDLLNRDDMENFNEDESELALKDIFTVYGLEQDNLESGWYRYGGKININTAGVDTLKALLPMGMEDFAMDLVDFRMQQSEEGDVYINSLDKGWYKKVIDLSMEEQEKFEHVISYSSNIFKVECTGKENSATIKFTAWIKREKHRESGKWMCRVIQMER